MSNLLIIIFLFLFCSCNQEHLILIVNYDKLKPELLLEQILTESGLKKREIIESEVISINTNEYFDNIQPTNIVRDVKPKVQSLSKHYFVNSGQEFSIVLDKDNVYNIIKSIQGNLEYLDTKSFPDKGVFFFKSKDRDGKIHFQVFDNTGNLIKNIYYYISIKNDVQNISSYQTNVIQTNEVNIAKIDITNITNITNLNEVKEDEYLLFIKSLNGLTIYEKITRLEERIKNTRNNKEKDNLITELIEILLSQRNFNKANNYINQINNNGLKNFYLGRLNNYQKKYDRAIDFYIIAIKSDFDIKTNAINELLNMLVNNNISEMEIVNIIMQEVNNLPEKKDFYALCLIRIARLNVNLKKIYEAKSLLEEIINGNYSKSIKKEAKKYYDDLMNNFLLYK